MQIAFPNWYEENLGLNLQHRYDTNTLHKICQPILSHIE